MTCILLTITFTTIFEIVDGNWFSLTQEEYKKLRFTYKLDIPYLHARIMPFYKIIVGGLKISIIFI